MSENSIESQLPDIQAQMLKNSVAKLGVLVKILELPHYGDGLYSFDSSQPVILAHPIEGLRGTNTFSILEKLENEWLKQEFEPIIELFHYATERARESVIRRFDEESGYLPEIRYPSFVFCDDTLFESIRGDEESLTISDFKAQAVFVSVSELQSLVRRVKKIGDEHYEELVQDIVYGLTHYLIDLYTKSHLAGKYAYHFTEPLLLLMVIGGSLSSEE